MIDPLNSLMYPNSRKPSRSRLSEPFAHCCKLISVTSNFSDRSIFLPGGDPPSPQVGFRRSELIPATNNGTDITVQGTATFHWSIRNDPERPLNFSHEYHVRHTPDHDAYQNIEY
jgi:Glycoside hydrolase 131 catalytic N-terminal domain